MKHLFGTDGIRGLAGESPLDPVTLRLIGQAIGEHLNGRVLIGRDPRESSPEICGQLKLGLEAAGASIKEGGILPTPAVALLICESDLSGGVMISASHNQFKDNGIKVFGGDGRKLDDAQERGIEARVSELLAVTTSRVRETRAFNLDEHDSSCLEEYLALIGKEFPSNKWLVGMDITLDCANGAMSLVAPKYLEALGASVTAIHANPNGTNINANCGAVHPESLINAVRENGSGLGVAYDGDGDRSIFVDENGRIVNGDAVLLVMSRVLKKAGTLEPPLVIGTAMTNYNLEQKLNAEGISLVRTDVGDRHIFREMIISGARLGGEPSGHIIFSDYGLSGDGLLTTLKLCEALIIEKASLSKLAQDWSPAPQLLENVHVEKKIPLETLPPVVQKIEEIRNTLDGRGRIVVRYSGTEPLLRIMIESNSNDLNHACAGDLIRTLRKALGTSR